MRLALTYDDIQLIPKFSNIKSRKDISLKTKLSKNYEIKIPIIASPMDTVCDSKMAKKLYDLGGVGCIHRFMSIDEQIQEVENVANYVKANIDGVVMAAIGVKEDDVYRAEGLVSAGANVLLIDVAHGDHQNVYDMIKNLKNVLPSHVDIIAGNVATHEGAIRLEHAGADGIRVGIGGGSLCTTRIKTGFGVPNVTSIEDVANVISVPVMADGGIRSSGDIVKALAVGADTVMLGSLLAGTEEAPGMIIEKGSQLFKRYRGSASRETKMAHNQENRNIEGESTVIPFKGGVKYIIYDLVDGIRSGLSYAGCDSIKEFHVKAGYNRVTNSGAIEGSPHLL